ncbi:hypothetical protein JKP88DRAFT_255138 [Tribonema minus]|uniref:Fibronectin type-III domain-containing protein n=1 Tax=Tribonema minus TaxID=303371 RepID=A0A835Z152_9STRA|nr:hypothetical protein JKP88DRAFT_255138 [Tribonema minus]
MATVIASKDATTDAFAVLSMVSNTFGSISVKWTNPAKSTATYQLTYRKTGETSNSGTPVVIAADAGVVTNTTVAGLEAATNYTFALERLENGSYVPQTQGTGAFSRTTYSVDLAASVGPDSALVQFTDLGAAVSGITFQVLLNGQALTGTPVSTAGKLQLLLSTLSPLTTYQWQVMAIEGSAQVSLGMQSFTTSSAGTLRVGSVHASETYLSWAGTAGGSYRLVNAATGAVMADSLGGTGGTTLRPLLPATPYSVGIESLRPDGSTWARDAVASFTTASSVLSIESSGSSQMTMAWTPAYDGAKYVLTYSTAAIDGAAAGATHSVSTTALSSTVTGLSANTAYTFALLVEETGGLVGLSLVSMGTTPEETAAHVDAMVADIPADSVTTVQPDEVAVSSAAALQDPASVPAKEFSGSLVPTTAAGLKTSEYVAIGVVVSLIVIALGMTLAKRKPKP